MNKGIRMSSDTTQPRHEIVKQLVKNNIDQLQRGYLAGNSRSRAVLAHLRRAATDEPGTDPTIWEYTINGLPASKQDSDDPNPQEWAVHIAMTLFASQQQSRSQPVNRPDFGFGRAIGVLDAKNPAPGGNVSPVRRRFDAAITADTLAELGHHLRGLIKQLRGADIGFDYPQLAADLYAFQFPGGPDKVRRRWARDFYRMPKNDQQTTDQPEQQQTITEE
jgi:CRISPR system Cascade subunit CasB